VIVGRRARAGERGLRFVVVAGPLLLVCVVTGPAATLAAEPGAPTAAVQSAPLPPLTGRSLHEALRLLQERGWPVVFSSRLVRDSMRVDTEPTGEGRRALLADLLRPHGLAVRDGAHDRLVVVAVTLAPTDHGRAPRAAPPPPRDSGISATSSATDPLPPGLAAGVEEEIVVTPARDARRGSSIVLFENDPAAAGVSPRLADDAMSDVATLPGASSVEGSAQISFRGGDGDDVLVRLDGLELVRPYHLSDFDNAVSFVVPSALERAEVFTGPYPAQYGERMGGVIDLTTRTPTRRHFSLGLDALGADASVSGLVGERIHWLATARSGSYQWPLERSGIDEHPRFWDSFGKLEIDLAPNQTLTADALVARDVFELSSEHRFDDASYESEWESSYTWIRHTAVLGRDLYAATVIGTGDVDHLRSGRGMAPQNEFAAHDRRALVSTSARQDWHWEAGRFGALEWGIDYERSDTTLDFATRPALAGPPLVVADGSSLGDDSVLESFDTTNFASYVSAQIHPARRLSLEIGVRHDSVTLSDERHWSPRLAATWEPGRNNVVRAAWGWFYQSQRPYELQLELSGGNPIAAIGSERAEHQNLSFERQLTRGISLEVSAYRRRLEAPRVRFENLFDPALVFPELGEDRVRIAPDAGSAEGVELTVRQARRGRLGWWATYIESSVVDEIDGRTVPRSNDEPHSLRAGLDWRAGRAWEVDAVWRYHSGWPTTAIGAELVVGADGAGEWVPALGPRNGERLPTYHRLDLRVGRSWTLGLGKLEAHLDLLNVYDRENLRGFENIRLVPDRIGGAAVTRDPVTWRGFVPAAGVRWSF
jgi:hypothetical protein